MMLSKKHRYLVVEALAQETGAQLIGEIRLRLLEAVGEFGLGRANPQLRFFDKDAKLAVVRVQRPAAKVFADATTLKVLKTTGSVRTARPQALKLLRERRTEASGASEDSLRRMQN